MSMQIEDSGPSYTPDNSSGKDSRVEQGPMPMFTKLNNNFFGNIASIGSRMSHSSQKEPTIPQYEASNIPFQKSEKYFNTDQASQHINFLLNSAAAMANSVQKVKLFPSGAKSNATKSSVLKPFKITFACRHSYNFELNDSSLAREYLALPVSNYSVLDSNLISKSVEQDDSFSIVLPLGDIISYMSPLRSKSNQSNGSSFDRLSLTVRAPVTVIPAPDLGLINMSSGNIVFIPTLHWDKIAGASTNQSTTKRNHDHRSFNLSSILPRWLVWGGDFEIDSADAVATPTTMPSDADGSRREASVCLPPLKSSIQAGFKLILKWDTEVDEKLDSLADSMDIAELLPLHQTAYSTEFLEPNETSITDSINLEERFQHTRNRTLVGMESRFRERSRRRSHSQSKAIAISPLLFAVAMTKKLARDAIHLTREAIAVSIGRVHFDERINFNQLYKSMIRAVVHFIEKADSKRLQLAEPYIRIIQKHLFVHEIATKFRILSSFLLTRFRRLLLRYYVLQVIPYVAVMRTRYLLLAGRFARVALTWLSAYYTLATMYMKSLAHGAFNSYLAQVLRHEVVYRMSTKTLRYVNHIVYAHVTTVTTFLQLLWSEIRNNHIIRNGVQFWMLNLRKIYNPIRDKAGRYISDVWDEMHQESSENPAFGGFRAFPSRSTVNISHADVAKIFRRAEQPILFVENSDLGYAVKLPSLTGDSFVIRKTDCAVATENASVSNVLDDGNIVTPLTVRASIQVWVDMNLPLSDESGVTNALGFPPVKLLLTQAGQLIIATVLKSTAPHLAKLLVKDFEARKRKKEVK
eukprot:gene23883-32278_t